MITAAIVTALFGFIISVTKEMLFVILTWVFERLSRVTGTTLLEAKVVTSILNSMGLWGGAIIAISILFLVIKLLTAISEGKKVDVTKNITAILIAVIFMVYGRQIALIIFYVFEFIRIYLVGNFFNQSGMILEAFFFGTELELLALIYLIIFMYQYFKIAFEIFERIAMYFFIMLQMYIYIPDYVLGNDKSLVVWLKQLATVCLGLILRFIGINLALYVASSKLLGMETIFMVVGILMATGKVDTILGHWGLNMSWGGVGRMTQGAGSMGMSSARTFAMLKGR